MPCPDPPIALIVQQEDMEPKVEFLNVLHVSWEDTRIQQVIPPMSVWIAPLEHMHLKADHRFAAIVLKVDMG